MSTGAGRVEQAIRDYLAEHHRHRHSRIVHPDALFVAAFGKPPWTRAQRGSVLRAMHRIIAGQPGWRVYSPEGKRGVVFEFAPPAETPKSKRVAAAHLMQRPVKAKPKSPRQRAREKREKQIAQERKQTLPYFWTAGRDTLPDAVADWLGLPRGCTVTTFPETTPRHRSGVGCQAFDHVIPPPQTEEEALRTLCLLDTNIRQAVSYEEVLWYQAKAGAIHYMFPGNRRVREETEIVHLMGHWWLGRHLVAVEKLRLSGSYSAPDGGRPRQPRVA
jgi:hypothetical protein